MYFYNRTFTREQLYRILYYLLLPVFSMVAFMYFKTPDFKEINFGGVAIAETSGGFGPNQVATIIGFAAFVSAAFLILKERLSGFLILDIFILIYFAYRGLLTFSRGGMLAAVIALVIFGLITILFGSNRMVKLLKYIAISSFISIGIWLYTSNVTGGMIENRYAGKNARGIKKKDVSAGRIKIFQAQLEVFYRNPIVGIGVGGSKYFDENGIKGDTAHDEIGRLISEHGLIGIILLIILITVPLKHILSQNDFAKALLIAFYLFWFLTINHSAMRVAFPGWIYGLSLINISDENDEDYEEPE